MSKEFWPSSYKLGSDKHPLIPFDRKCKGCRLTTDAAVNGGGPDDLTAVRLIVISDYTGHYETEENYPMYSNDPNRARRKLKTGRYSLEGLRNAGSVLRYTLKLLFNLDTYEDCWITNAIKCDPKRNTPTESDVKDCVTHWLNQELEIVSEYAPTAPILIAGRLAFKSLKTLDPALGKTLTNLKESRKTSHHRLGEHPLVFTFNPAPVAKSAFRVETDLRIDTDDCLDVTNLRTIEPPLIGSAEWDFRNDLEYLRPFL